MERRFLRNDTQVAPIRSGNTREGVGRESCSSPWKAPKVPARPRMCQLWWRTSRKRAYAVFPTREPGGTSIGEQIRKVIHDLKNVEMHPRTETLLVPGGAGADR